jgi:hypothetical protein
MSTATFTHWHFVSIVVAGLAVLQGTLGLLRSFEVFRVGADLTGRGAIFIPLMGLITVARGGLIGGTALLYILFACGALMRKQWGWWAGLIAAVINGLLVLGLVLDGEAVVHSLFWAVVPAILLWYLFSPAGRELLRN